MHPAGGAVIVYLGLGSNLGEREAHLQGAVLELAQRGVRTLRLSPLYAGPHLGPGGPAPDYLNAVLEGETALEPLELLDVTQSLETAHGRPPGTHLRPRPLDLDILFYGGWRVWHPRLVIPHPRLAERRFVLQPLHDLGVLEALPLPALARRLEALRELQPLRAHTAHSFVGVRP